MAAAADLVEQLGISEILLSMETIKPSSPTPPDLRTHTLSWIDQIVVSTHVGVVLFYLQGGGGGGGDGFAGAPGYTTSERLCLLKQSLSHALSLYYVLAGRIGSGGASGAVNCTDEGIDFIDARVGCPLSAVLQTTTKNPEESGTVVDLFLPCGRRCTMGAGGPLLIVKATTFSCGGMALGLCLNHTVADGQSLAFFLKTWASIARGVPDVEVSLPALDAAAAAFPLLGMLSPYPWPPADTGRPRMVRKRFVLDGSKICALREQSTNRALTRVEAVTALIWRCLIRSYSSAIAPGVEGVAPVAAEFAACHDVGLRARMRPPLPETSFGNLFMWVAAFVACHPVDLPLIDEVVTADSNSINTTLRRLTEEQISAAIRGMDAAYIRDTLQGPERPSDFHSELGERLQRGATLTWFTSWWGFPFYEADFGWGRPTWVACGGLDNFSLESLVVLMGRRDVGGHMEAWVWSGAEEMAKLDNDPELLSLLSSDPPPHMP